MKYLKNIFLGLSIFSSLWMYSCGDGSDDLTPGDPEINHYEVDPADNSKEANIRRNFYDQYDIYLIFSDLLGTYVDSFGNEREERVDFHWSLDTYTTFNYTFDELEDDEKEIAAEIFSKYFLPYINIEKGKLKPYSVLLIKNLYTDQEYEGEMEETSFINSFRCLGVDVKDFIGADVKDGKILGKQLLKDLIDSHITKDTPELAPFFDISADYYSNYYIARHIPEWLYEQNVEWVYEAGFLYYIEDWYGELDYDMFPNEKNDLKSYMNAIFSMDQDEFAETWGDYPVIMQKYEILKQCIKEVGIDLNAVE